MNTLFEEFSATSADAWKERLAKDLKGITFSDLSIRDRNGNTIHPFYSLEDQQSIKGAIFDHKDWTICAEIVVGNEKIANAKALEELQNGASSLCFIIGKRVDLSVLLRDIQLQYIQTRFSISKDALSFFNDWQQYLNDQGISEIEATIIYDPIAAILKTNDYSINKEQWLSNQQDCLAIDTCLFQNAGANTVSQLAYAVAQCNEYLNWLSDSSKINRIKYLNIALSVGTDFFEEIAKLRALRILFNNLISAYDIKPEIHIHVVTSDSYRSPFDAYSNLLRDTVSAMAAVLGGCHSLLIHSFDHNKNEQTHLGIRMSRNQQLILKEEAYFNQIADASSGSFYIETLTNELAEQAWDIFKQIEKDGGLLAQSEKGLLKSSIATQAQQWIDEYKSGKRVLIGVNKYLNATDPPSAIQAKASKGIRPIILSEELM